MIIKEIDILNSKDEAKQLIWWSLPGFALGMVVIALAILNRSSAVPDVPFTKSIFSWCMVVAAGYIISLPVHELIHAAFFKLLGPRGTQIKFGFKQGLLYTTCPGTHIERARFMVILMAPFVILSAVYLVFGLVSHEYSATLALFLLHASGCAGDMYFTWCILRNPQANMVEDTSVGITLWQE